MNRLVILMGNQLWGPDCWAPEPGTVVLMVEDGGLCRRHRYHQQKIGLILAAMREHAATLRTQGVDVVHVPLGENASFVPTVAAMARRVEAASLVAFLPASQGQRRLLEKAATAAGKPLRWLRDPGFLSAEDEARELLGSGKPRMANFYRRQRRRLGVLLEDDKPCGGRWSFDAENRHPLPSAQCVPPMPVVNHSPLTRTALDEVHAAFPGHPGDARELWLPTTRDGAREWLSRFVDDRLVGFGTYEDAISVRSNVLFHSALSPLMNVGLLTPHEVLAAVLTSGRSRGVPLNDLEGFVRQLIGWREFVRAVYLSCGENLRAGNVWGAKRRMTQSWFDANTGIVPLDAAIANARRWGWNHHIERLMVIANLQNLCEIDPSDAYRFFMEFYVDAYDWVMVPNLFGMGLTSDGGTFATQPYVCGSNYLLRMSDYPKGEWCDVVDGLYWRFVAKHRDVFAANPRTRTRVVGLERMQGARRERIFGAAESFLRRHTR